ncbi:MAG: GNAT family N-acetyltransferase [Promethearchaeota archaeon]|jgi:RimJ/RimL family protein N-acetyltransferase
MGEKGVYKFIDGEKIALQPINLDHVSTYCKWQNDPIVRKYLRIELPLTIEEIKKYLEPVTGVKTEILFEIYHKIYEREIGFIGLADIHWLNRNAKLFYSIGEKEYWGQNLATEATKLIVEYGFNELNLHRIYASVFLPNKASHRVLEKAGFNLEATIKEEAYVDGMYIDVKQYYILRNEWINNR